MPILGLESSDFTPTFNCYKKDNKIIVRIEAPGNFSIKNNFDFKGEYCIIKINGMQMKDKDFDKIDNLYNSRNFGNIAIDIPLKADEFLLLNEAPKSEYKKGIFILEYILGEKCKKVALDEEI